MFRLATRNIFRHGSRTALTLAGIVLGVVGIVLSGGFVNDIFHQLREATIHSQLGHLQVYKAGYSTLGRRDPYRYLIEAPAQVAGRTAAWPEVSEIMMRVNFSGLANNGIADLPIVGEGVEPHKEAGLGTFVSIIEGRQLADTDRFGVLVGKGVARALKVHPGDYLIVLTNTPEGTLNSLDFEVIGVFQSFSREYDERAIRIPLLAARELLTTGGVHSLVLSLEATEDTDIILDRLSRELPAGEFEVKPWYELAGYYRKTVALYQRQFAVLQFIILFMVLLSVANSVNMSIYERTGEFGTLMALGNRRRDVFRLVVTEHVLLGLAGAGLGAAFGVLLAWAISRVGIPMPPPPNADVGYIAYIRIVPQVVGMGFVVGALATILAAILPARRASRLPVAVALRANS